jgi:4-hydroxy-tetrahydrodipicolinate reductase
MTAEGHFMSIAVLGAAGRMGCAVVRAIAETPGLSLVAAVDHPTCPQLGHDVGEIARGARAGVLISDRLPAAGAASVWIDFSVATATAATAATAAERGAALVVGTTGVDAIGKQALAAAAGRIPVVFTPNMSVGVNVLLRLVADAARLLGPDYDSEIVETHHRQKRDAPSGTALRLAESVASATGGGFDNRARFARHGDIGPRLPGEIGIQSLRGGDVVGDHTVFFLGAGERIEITHKASSRDTFARGAVRAALWAPRHPPGLYDMQDVLGLKD